MLTTGRDKSGGAGRLSARRGVLFAVVALEDMVWQTGSTVVRAGELGLAVLAWAGRAPGYFVEWEGGMSIGVLRADEGRTWRRLIGSPQTAGMN